MYITVIIEKLCSFNQTDKIEIDILNEFSSVECSNSLFFSNLYILTCLLRIKSIITLKCAFKGQNIN